MSKHRCDRCNPELIAKFGRDVNCPGYRQQVIDDQLTEDTEDGRALRAELAKEATEDRVKKPGPQ